MLKLISGSMIGESFYTTIRDDLSKVEDIPDTAILSENYSTPTLSGIAHKVAKVEKLTLDYK